ncbi:hypothetical protein ACFRJ1_31225 [Streptomyces sp. NPDC056773]|uniref:hypothetical protein n=1 Tax=unclassified Streptomyces TaxID=2593676 RepID=UPI0036C27F17
MTPWAWKQPLCRWPDCDHPAEGPEAAPGRFPGYCNGTGEDGAVHNAQNWWIRSRPATADPAPAPLTAGGPGAGPAAESDPHAKPGGGSGYRQALDETRTLLDEAVLRVEELIGRLAHLYEAETQAGLRTARAEASLEAAVAAHDAAVRRAAAAEEERAVAERQRWAADAAAVEAVRALHTAQPQSQPQSQPQFQSQDAARRPATPEGQVTPSHLALVGERQRSAAPAAPSMPVVPPAPRPAPPASTGPEPGEGPASHPAAAPAGDRNPIRPVTA